MAVRNRLSFPRGSVTSSTGADSRNGQVAVLRADGIARLLPTLALVVVLLGALVIRVDFARHVVVFKDDHGTAALMSLHILQGRETPVYFYGWFYIAAIGAYVGAAMFALFGVSVGSLCLAMTLFTLLWVYATYLLFSRLVGKWGGVIAAALVAFAPFTVMWYSVVPLLGYPPTFAFGTLVLYLGVRLNDRELSSRAEWGCLIGMGALTGIAIWTNPLCAAYLIVGFGLLVAHVVRSRFRRGLLIKLAVAFGVLLVALLPVLVTVFEYGFAALFGFRSPRFSLVPQNFELLHGYYVKDMLLKGSSAQGPVRWLVTAAYAIPAAVFLVGFIVGIIKRNRRVLRAAFVPLLFVLVYGLLFLPSPMASTHAPRYFVPFFLGVSAMFAFPLVFRRAWVTAATAALALVVVILNIAVNIDLGHGQGAGAGARRMAEMRALVAEVKAVGLRHVMIDTLEGQTLTFVAREDVIFARTFGERYYPYAVSAATDDTTGIAKGVSAAPAFRETLRSLGVAAPEPIVGADVAVFCDFVLPGEALRLVEPEAVFVGTASPISGEARWLVDRNDETIVGGRYDDETVLVVDFGRDVSLCGMRFVAPHERDYPAGYTLSGLPSGAEWTESSEWDEIQRVNWREALACIYGNRLYHRGHFTVMECRFTPRSVRYLKLDGLRRPAARVDAWRFREAYFYECEEGTGRPDEQEATEIARELASRGVELAICDEWLSRKIERLPQPRPSVLPHYELRKPASQVPRVVPIQPGVAIVIENGHAEECHRLIEGAALDEAKIAAREFPHYTALIIEKAPACYDAFPGLKWSSFTLVGTARIATAAWYHKRGESLERAGRADDAMRYYARAFRTFPGIPANLEKLAPHDDEAASRLKALAPEFTTPCSFSRSISLVGYTLVPSTLVPCESVTLRLVWELEGTMPHDYLPVFVHFLDGRKIAFQADHNVVFPVVRGAEVPRCLVLDEHEFTVPRNCKPGRLAIHLGALKWGNQSKRLRPRTKLPKHHRAVEVGTVVVSR